VGTDELLLNTEFVVEAVIDPRSPAVEIARAGPVHRAHFVLPRGQYIVRARIGDTEQRREIDLQAAEKTNALIEIDAGRVALQMVRDEDNEPLGYTWFSVYRVERDGRQRRRVFNDGYYSERELILPEGRYIAFGRHRHLAGEKDFEVRAGEFSRVAIAAH
jgi:Tol biopolymer transport system component